MREIYNISALGHQGDGIVTHDAGRIFVPFTLAGERVEISRSSTRGNLVSMLEPSLDRIDPVCEYFGRCGGCQMQHYSHQPYLSWKQNIVKEALTSQNILAQVMPVVAFTNDKRRRAVFSATHSSSGIDFGFTQKSSQKITNIANCPVVTQAIAARIDAIKKIIRPVLPPKGNTSVHVLECDNGLDIHIDSAIKQNEKSRRLAIRLALEEDISRLSFGDEIWIETRRPMLKMGAASVCVPPGTFVQAMAAAEIKMAELVGQHLVGCKKIADLFCGVGTFALRLAQHSTISACESNGEALEALDEAWRGTGGRLKTITTQQRNLFLRPMMVEELKKIQGVVFDPPRAGAMAQVKQLAKSKIVKIAAVSCNPTSLAQDLAILIEGGFKLVSVTPLDQFVFTPHVEVVALLER